MTTPESRPGVRPGEYPLPAFALVKRCPHCGAKIIWTTTVAGRPRALSVATIRTIAGMRYALTHAVDCPHAQATRAAAAQPPAPRPARQDRTAALEARKARYQLADGTLPLLWWRFEHKDFRVLPNPAAETSATAAAASDDEDANAP